MRPAAVFSYHSVLELPLLFDLLEAYQRQVLWAAVGWFFDTYRETFFVGDEYLARIEQQYPGCRSISLGTSAAECGYDDGI